MRLEPPRGLCQQIIAAIHGRELRAARRQFVMLGILSLASFAAAIPALAWFASDLSRTGFSNYFSLLFSDGSLLASYWREFSLVLLESLPLASLLVFLSAALVGLWSAGGAIKNYSLTTLKWI